MDDIKAKIDISFRFPAVQPFINHFHPFPLPSVVPPKAGAKPGYDG